MKDKEEKIDWDKVAEKARAAFLNQASVIDFNDFREGFVLGYREAFEEWR